MSCRWVIGSGTTENRTITESSDGYGTGFAICVLRQAGVPADDPRMRCRHCLVEGESTGQRPLVHSQPVGRQPTLSEPTGNCLGDSGAGGMRRTVAAPRVEGDVELHSGRAAVDDRAGIYAGTVEVIWTTTACRN